MNFYYEYGVPYVPFCISCYSYDYYERAFEEDLKEQLREAIVRFSKEKKDEP